jgi:hypothetical protein
MKVFWMVWCPSNGSPNGAPKLQHATFGSAKREAERLAQNYQSTSFIVLRAVGVARTVEVQWEDAKESEDTSF